MILKRGMRLLTAAALLALCTGCGSKTEQSEESASTLESVSQVAEEQVQEVDVLVIGAGGAGMSAALSAQEQGVTVAVLEKESISGGNTSRATGGMNASETKFQKAQGIEDTNDLYYDETLKGGKGTNDPALLRKLVDESASAIEWLDSLGMPLPNVTFSGGFSVERIHRPEDGSAVGSFLVERMTKKLEEKNIPILYETKAVALIEEEGKIVGVKAENAQGSVEFRAKSIVIATGGFGANLEMVKQYQPSLEGFVTTNAQGATGDGAKMVEEVSGALVDMDQIQIHPTVEQTTSDLITEALRGEGAILVNTEGKRFTNELLTRDVVSQEELKQPTKSVFILFDQKVRDNNKAVEKYINRGYTLEGATVSELAEKMEVEPSALQATLDEYNASVASGKDEAFGRETGLHSIDQANFYAIRIAPGVHHTMGGIKINDKAEVLKDDGAPLLGLYAAGEVVGGVHGSNRIGGNAVTDIVVFGREAGKQAATYAKSLGETGKLTIVVPEETSVEEVPSTVPAQYVDGEYEETVKGHNGDLTVKVVIKEGKVIEVSFPKMEETPAIFSGVEKDVVPAILQTQSADVDAASGATVSSEAVKSAVKKILEENKR